MLLFWEQLRDQQILGRRCFQPSWGPGCDFIWKDLGFLWAHYSKSAWPRCCSSARDSWGVGDLPKASPEPMW